MIESDGSMEQLWKVILMAILQGITAFLPVSASGHNEVLRQIIGLEFSNPLYLDIVLHFGVVLAVAAAFCKDTLRLIVDGTGIVFDGLYNSVTFIGNLFRGREKARRYHQMIFTTGRKLWLLLTVSGLMSVLVGLILSGLEEVLISSFGVIGAGMIACAVVLYLCDDLNYGMKRIGEAEILDAAVIGTAQGISVIPGVSRFALTLYLGLKCGFERGFAIKFSFLSMIAASTGALVLQWIRYGSAVVTSAEALQCGIGFFVSFAVSILLIRPVLRWMLKHPLRGFAIYSLVSGAALIAAGIIR